MATTPVFLPGEPHGQRSLEDFSPWGRKESDTTKHSTLLEKRQHALNTFILLSTVIIPVVSFLFTFMFSLFKKRILNQDLELIFSLPNTFRRRGVNCKHTHYRYFSSTYEVARGTVLILFAKYHQSVFGVFVSLFVFFCSDIPIVCYGSAAVV